MHADDANKLVGIRTFELSTYMMNHGALDYVSAHDTAEFLALCDAQSTLVEKLSIAERLHPKNAVTE